MSADTRTTVFFALLQRNFHAVFYESVGAVANEHDLIPMRQRSRSLGSYLAALPIHAKSGREWGPKRSQMNGPSRDGNIVFLAYREEAQRKIRCVLCFGHFATLCLVSQPMEWGANGEVLDKCLCLQRRRLGTHGEESCKSFRNGEQGRG